MHQDKDRLARKSLKGVMLREQSQTSAPACVQTQALYCACTLLGRQLEGIQRCAWSGPTAVGPLQDRPLVARRHFSWSWTCGSGEWRQCIWLPAEHVWNMHTSTTRTRTRISFRDKAHAAICTVEAAWGTHQDTLHVHGSLRSSLPCSGGMLSCPRSM